MPVTGLRGRQILDGDVFRNDINITTTGSAVIRKVIAGTNISISSTGVDTGTGDVTINATGLLPLAGGTLTGTLLFANATSPNTHTIQFGDNTGWTLRMMTSVSGTPTQRFSFTDLGTFSAVGQIISTKARTTADGTGQIFLNGTGGNRIDWNAQGVAAPSFTTRSAGTKLVLFPSVNATQVDYGLGIDSDTMWFSIAVAGGNYKWYGGTTPLMQLIGGSLVIGNISAVAKLVVRGNENVASLYLTDATNASLYITHTTGGRTSFFNGAATQWLMEVGGNVTLGSNTAGPSKLFVYNTNIAQSTIETTTSSTLTTLQDTIPLRFNDFYNSGNNGHNLIFTSTAASGLWEYNITKTFGGQFTIGVAAAGGLTRQFYVYGGGQIRFANYTTTTSFTGTAVGVLAFDASGNILTIATPGGGGGGGVGGSGTLNYIPKWNAGNSITDSQIFDNGSNVGIGTATPTNITNYRTLHIQGGTGGAIVYFSTSDGTGRGYIYGSTVETAINCPTQFRVYVGGTTKILSSSVGTGFGATTPAAMVDVVGSANFRNNDGNIMNTQGLSIVNVGTYTTFGANGGDVMMLGLQNTSAVNGGSVFRYQFGLYGDASGQELRISTVTTTSSIVGRFALKPNGQLRLDNYTSLSSFTGTKVGYLAFTSTGDIICDAGGGGTTEVITMYRIAFAAELANTWSNMPSTLQFFDSSSSFSTRADLSTFNEVRLIVNKQGTAGANGSKLILRYQANSGAPFTQGSYSNIGTSEVSVAINVTNDILATNWIPMAANAMDDVFVALLGEGGNNTADPVFGSIYAEFRYNPNIVN